MPWFGKAARGGFSKVASEGFGKVARGLARLPGFSKFARVWQVCQKFNKVASV